MSLCIFLNLIFAHLLCPAIDRLPTAIVNFESLIHSWKSTNFEKHMQDGETAILYFRASIQYVQRYWAFLEKYFMRQCCWGPSREIILGIAIPRTISLGQMFLNMSRVEENSSSTIGPWHDEYSFDYDYFLNQVSIVSIIYYSTDDLFKSFSISLSNFLCHFSVNISPFTCIHVP